MKALFFHADHFGYVVESPSDRIGGATPEQPTTRYLRVEECLVALFHVEEADGDHQIKRLCKDILRIAEKVGATRLVVAAFGHLSSSYAPMDTAMEISRNILEKCRESGMELHSSPFGHNKTFELMGKGHPDAVKHRSY